MQDIDTRPEDIRYNHHAIPNGELVRVDDPSRPVFQFTQADLNDRKILFKHLGSLFGRIMLWVSDGQYFVSTELKVRASQPFVRLVNNPGNDTPTPVLVGVFSFMLWGTCTGANEPAYFGRVSDHMDWINMYVPRNEMCTYGTSFKDRKPDPRAGMSRSGDRQ